MNSLAKPQPNEYPAYFEKYLKLLPKTDILVLLGEQVETLLKPLEELKESATEKGYAEGKWSLKELIQHMLDTERIMAYRALCFSRGEWLSLPGFDENMYAENSQANSRKMIDIINEYRLQRQSTIALINSFSPEMLLNIGNANGNKCSVRSMAWIIAAHEAHHLQIIQTRYLMLEV